MKPGTLCVVILAMLWCALNYYFALNDIDYTHDQSGALGLLGMITGIPIVGYLLLAYLDGGL